LPHYHTSVIQNKATQQKDHHIEATTRNSQTAWLLSPDPVVDCVRTRAAAFQGFAPNRSMDALAAVKYDAGQQYRPHYDWDVFNARAADRRTSFFAILEANCSGGATRFPDVRRTAWRSRKPWCGKGWVECGEEEEGLAVKPVVGNALFWVNFREDGSGHEGTLHAGMPVVEGTKIGLNIWTYGKVKAPE
ncbi:putative prolyl 4-hydroxylase 3, partial [Lasiodiplodia hormozganensis]